MTKFGLAIGLVCTMGFGGIHDDIENCAVTSDAACLRGILHRIASSDGTAIQLLSGNYTKTGSSNLCPQNVVRLGSGEIRVTYISPCSGTFDDMICTGDLCANAAKTRSVTITSNTTYYYQDESGNRDNFRRDASALNGGVARNH